jgi:polyhydroxyalkanoate synthesis regulator phasin
MGQTPTDPTAGFMDRVALKLGIEPDKLEQAIKDTRNEDIDARVQRGDLTQDEADALKKRMDDGDGFGPFGHDGKGRRFPGHGPGGEGFHPGFGFGFPGQLDELASFLGIEQIQLHEELAVEGATLATVAEAHGKTREELKASIVDNTASKLDEAVAAGKLTQEQADEIKARTGEMVDNMIDGEFGAGPGGRHFRFDFEFRAGPDGDDGAAPPPSSPAPQRGSSSDAQRS